MIQTTKSLDVSSLPTKTFEGFVRPVGVVEATTVAQPCVVFRLEDYTSTRIDAPPRHKSVGDLVNKWSKDDKRRAALEQARVWFADSFHGEESITVRALRLRKGWSQSQLADELGTSQPHVARIERGTENVTIDTCRRLSKALGVDMNTLDTALRRQEELAAKKAE